MNIKTVKVNLTCLFCDSPLTGEEDAEFASGDMTKCAECGEENNYDAVLMVAEAKGMLEMEKQAITIIKKGLPKLFK